MTRETHYWKDRIKESAVLNPVDRISEVLFGLIMVLTFTGAISASNTEREEVRELLWAALGCNIAWGLVDAIMFIMNVAVERGHLLKRIEQVHSSTTDADAGQIVKEEIAPGISGLMTDTELAALGNRIRQLPKPAKTTLVTLRDLVSGLEIFLLVFLCTLPVALPFALINNLEIAMRASNGVALVLLFTGGFILAGYAGFRRIITALVYAFIGILLVLLTMALGG